ncbi:hypothetical protein L7F22_000316 [Adiantum nelumboides]|nr:hypothetical protein [Adiantum nelumboides]
MGEATEGDVAPLPTHPIGTPEALEEQACVEGAEEKKIVTDSAPEEEKVVVPAADRDVSLPVSGEEAPPPFIEESYFVKDLKESEKKALLELKAKIEEAIKNNTFLAPPKHVSETASREIEVEKKEEEEAKEEKKEEDEEKGEEAVVVKEEVASEVLSIEEAPFQTKEAPIAPSTEDFTATTPGTEESSVPAPEAEFAPPSMPESESTEVTSRDISIDEDDSPSLEDLALWGVPLLHSKGDERTDVILLKFLRARDFKVGDAMGMLKDTVVWRKEFGADSLVDEEITTEYDPVAYMHGVDKEGHPVCYNHYGVFQDKELYQKTFGDDAQFKKFLRWRIQMLERGIQKLDFNPSGVHSMVQITDLNDSPGFVKRRNITKKALTLLQDNYPELVAKQIFINVPWYFGALYSLHGKIVTPRSKSKVVVARSEKVTETLFKCISPENVPLKYGGLSRPGDTEFENVDAPVKELMVKASEKQTIELPVEKAGSTVVWDVTVVGWDVVYGEEFVPSAENSYSVIIQKSKKLTAAEEPVRNSFKAAEAGKVVLTIDNTSRRKKLAVYRHINRETPSEC